jgi:N-acetyl-anhydromuramyl-L-alanine amidase AmpD
MRRYVLDPGHGGSERLGSSTPIGVRGPRGTAEKDVTLKVARALARRLPGAVLTRNDDRNLTLGQRVAAARRASADVFLSLHANAGQTAQRGAEIWVHPRSGPGTRALAARLRRALGGATPGGARVMCGDLAVLDPAQLGRRTDACLVELDYLSHPEGERRLGDPGEIERIARMLAEAVQGSGDPTDMDAGEAASDADFESEGIDGPIPDQPSSSSSGSSSLSLARPLDSGSQTDYPQASRFSSARAGFFTVPAAPRTISRIVIHITDGTTTNGAVSWFQSADNKGKTSSHYVVGQDGEVVQMVRDANIAHHAHGANGDSIGIEHVALSPNGAKALSKQTGKTYNALYPTENEYRASAALVAWLCQTYNIPADRDHIIGHSEADTGTAHADCPNAAWDWDKYMRYVRDAMAPSDPLPQDAIDYSTPGHPPSAYY